MQKHTVCKLSHIYCFVTCRHQSLSLSSRARATTTTGEIVNLMSVDAQQIGDSVTYLHFIWSVFQNCFILGKWSVYHVNTAP